MHLMWAHRDIAFVLEQLDTVRDERWNDDLVAEKLSGGTIRLQGVLDGFVMLDQVPSDAVRW